MTGYESYAEHSSYSDPGRHADLVAAVAPEPAAIHRVAVNVIAHYRVDGASLRDEQRTDVDLRWLSSLLDVGQERAPGPLDLSRPPEQRLAGCCRDRTLLAVSILRQHGVPARSRVGFLGYFGPGFHYDHVVAEFWNGDRWVRFDPGLGQDDFDFDAHDMPTGPGSPFQTAAEVWRSSRAGDLDAGIFGVDPSMPHLCGSGFVRSYVVAELAHRMGDETLLWDVWGTAQDAIEGRLQGSDAEAADQQADTIADLLIRADTGDDTAEARLAAMYANEPGLAPADAVVTMSPLGRRGVTDLRSRVTTWQPMMTADYTVSTA